MTVAGLGVEPESGATVIVLEGPEGEQLAMVIGMAEASSIAKALEELELPRPLTHDLFHATLGALGARVQRIEVVDLRDGTYFAELVLVDASGQERRQDSRPSDAIALALRAGAPILVHAHVLGEAPSEPQDLPSPADKEGWKKLLEKLGPEDFKYKM